MFLDFSTAKSTKKTNETNSNKDQHQKHEKKRPQRQQQVKMSNFEMQKQSRGSHRSVTTRFNNEAENIMSKDLDTISEADINRLNQVAKLLTP